jgi:hypothetical protein
LSAGVLEEKCNGGLSARARRVPFNEVEFN